LEQRHAFAFFKAITSLVILPALTFTSTELFAGGIQTLDTVEVVSDAESLIGVADSASQGTVLPEQIKHRPLRRPAEVLEAVPGLIVTQHSGSGKANQYFLRGFNLDHGTDFAIYLDGMPINMPTHGHGQGYADANFLIPELISGIAYRKGPYFAEEGDFSAAGAARIRYAEQLPSNQVELGVGEDGYGRVLFTGSPALANGHVLYAVEAQHYDGPWDLPEDLEKYNGVLRFSRGSQSDGWDVTAMAYSNTWNSTDQVPLRAIKDGTIGRFGNIDPTDGGKTHRYSLSGNWRSTAYGGNTQANAYVIDYRLNLFSNFTYFLDDPVNGDQFEQLDDRTVFGGAFSHAWLGKVLGIDTEQSVGLQLRHDAINAVGLFHTTNRLRTGTVRLDEVGQSSAALYYQAAMQVNPWLRVVPGLRGDLYRFNVTSDNPLNSGNKTDSIVSPKLAVILGPWANTEFYLNAGRGFHSNDARGTTITVDPNDGVTPVPRVDALVPATGYELGLRSNPLRGLQTALAVFQLDIDSELLFIGDAGATEASRTSRRVGVEWANFWKPSESVTLDFDMAYTRARFQDYDPAGDYIPGAIEGTASLGLMLDRGRWFGGARLRYFGPRPLIEDNSVRSKSSTLVNIQGGYRITNGIELELAVLNLFDRAVSDIDYLYESQLAGEPAPVMDIHTHPAEPRTVRLTLRSRF